MSGCGASLSSCTGCCARRESCLKGLFAAERNLHLAALVVCNCLRPEAGWPVTLASFPR
jgi:hypothetical protein